MPSHKWHSFIAFFMLIFEISIPFSYKMLYYYIEQMFEREGGGIDMKWERLFEMERSYTTLSFSDRFEYIYDSFEGFESKMNFQIRALEYAIEEAMFAAQQEGYMDRYSWDHRKESKERVREYLKNGCAVDFELETGLAPNEWILTQYNNLQLIVG